jgi:hypothetical protein
MSLGGAALYAPVQGSAGDRIALCLDQVGAVEGVITRSFSSGFALRFVMAQARRDELAQKIARLTRRGADNNMSGASSNLTILVNRI